MNDKMDLSLSGGNGPADSQHRQAAPEPTPICGMMACGFGILGIFGPALFFHTAWVFVFTDCVLSWPSRLGVGGHFIGRRRLFDVAIADGHRRFRGVLHDFRLAGIYATGL